MTATATLPATQSTNAAQSTALAERPVSSLPSRPGFHSAEALNFLMEMSDLFSKSHLVPILYRANQANCAIAINMATRMGMDPMTVMQNLYLIQGKPSWSSQFLIACWNTCGRFSPIRYEWSADRKSCRAWSEDLKTGEKLLGTTITMAMAKAEGWLDKPGSKWKTMPEQMLMYRAAAFLCRAYAAEISLGIMTSEEAEDIAPKLTNQSQATQATQETQTAGKMEGPWTPAIDLQTILPAEVTNVITDAAEEIIEASVTETIVSETPAEVSSPSPAVTTVQMLEPPTSTTTQEAPISENTFENLATLVRELAPPKDKWIKSLQNKFGEHVTAIKHLTEAQGQQMITWATKAVEKKRLNDVEQWATGKLKPTEEPGDNSPPFPT